MLLLALLVIASGGVALYRSAVRIYLFLELTPDINIKVYFGDLLNTPGVKVIAVNEYLDGELGTRVSPNSLHGKMITKYFNGKSNEFEAAVDRSLSSIQSEETSRSGHRDKKYPIGTTAVIEQKGQTFCLPVLAETDIQSNKANCDSSMLTKAMQGLWKAVRDNAQGEQVVVPLMGSGQAQVGLPPQQLLQLIVMTIVEASKSKITDEIHIVLPYSLLGKIDLDAIYQQWS